MDVLLPKRPAWRDYAKRIEDVVRLLAGVENRSELSILRDLAQVSADTIRLRVQSRELRDGAMPLGDAVQLAAAGRGMLLAAACAAEQPRRAYHTRKPSKAMDFVDALKLGQTERGSFILTVLSPVPPTLRPVQTHFPMDVDTVDADEPYARRVTRTLGQALHLAADAAERGIATGRLTAFEEAIPHGVSADLCEAIALLRRARSIEALDVSLNWATTRPVRAGVPSRSSFSPDVIDVIGEAGRLLRERAPREDFEVVGPVIKVEREGAEKRGTVVVYGSVDGQPRKIKMALVGDSWELAHKALDDRTLLRCEGDLVKVGRGFELEGPRRASIISSDGDDESD